MNEWSFLIQHGRIQDGCLHQVESEWMSEIFFVQMVGTNLGKWEQVWEEKWRWPNTRWPNPTWQNSRWLPSSSWVRMNDFESDWISLSQSQSGVRVFLSESERGKQGVWIQHGRIQDGCHHQVESEWMTEVFLIQHGRIQDGCLHQVESEWMTEVFLIQHGRIQDGCHHQVESEWMSEGFFVQLVGTNLGKCEWVW